VPTATTVLEQENPVARSFHDIGLAAWFGGSLMGAVGLNGASAEVTDAHDRTRVANAGWGRWMPVNAVAIGSHLLGGAQLTLGNKSRIAAQQGVATAAAAKAGLTAAALAATAYSGKLGSDLMEIEEQAQQFGSGVPTEGGTQPADETPPEARDVQRRLRIAQWVVPALTGALFVLDAYMSEQERPAAVARGFFDRVMPNR
jgi:hypothetical protein